jgi:serine/threonine protein kinase
MPDFSLPLPGQLLLGQYRVESFLASGGMGSVYKVWDLKRNVPLAMKVLNPDLAGDPLLLKYLRTEGAALQKLDHPNIVRFYGFYQTPELVFLLEDYIAGPSLREVLKQRQGAPLTLQEVVTYCRTLCPALQYAHSQGIIHCDIKPGNVLLNRQGQVFLADFSTARFTAASLTSTHGAGGTPAYMAPEQIDGQDPLPQTDIYALGVMLFEMLAGVKPFTGKSGSLLSEHLYARPPSLRAYNPQVSPELEAVVLRCLEKDVQRRYPDAMALLSDLSHCLPEEARPASPAGRWEGQQIPLKSAPGWLWILVAGILLTVLVLALLFRTATTDSLTSAFPTTQSWPAATVRDTPSSATPIHSVTATPRIIPPSPTVPLPRTVAINSCMTVVLDPSNYVDECVNQITLLPDRRLQLWVIWRAYLVAGKDVNISANDVGNMYLTDETGKRYDFEQVGGSASQPFMLLDGQSAQGWFTFPSETSAASFLILHNGDYPGVQTQPVARQWP